MTEQPATAQRIARAVAGDDPRPSLGSDVPKAAWDALWMKAYGDVGRVARHHDGRSMRRKAPAPKPPKTIGTFQTGVAVAPPAPKRELPVPQQHQITCEPTGERPTLRERLKARRAAEAAR